MIRPMIHTHRLILAACFAMGTVAQAADNTIDSTPQAILEPVQVTPAQEAVASSSPESAAATQTGDDLKSFGWMQTEPSPVPGQAVLIDTVSSNNEPTEDAPELVAETATPGQEVTMTFPLDTGTPADVAATPIDPNAEIDQHVAVTTSEQPVQLEELNPITQSSEAKQAESLPGKAKDARPQTIAVVPVTEFAPATPNAETPLPLNVDLSVNVN